MKTGFAPGDSVQTPLGKGVILEVRNRSVLVQVQDRAILLDARNVTAAASPKAAARSTRAAAAARPHGRKPPSPDGVSTVDLHGLTVNEALDAVIAAINDALLNDASTLRVIHGRSGGRLRAAVHRHAQALPHVKHARLDRANPGVTIIVLW